MGCLVELYNKQNEFVGYFGWKYNKDGQRSKRMVIVDNLAYALLYNDKATEYLANYMYLKDNMYKNYKMKLIWDGMGLNPDNIVFSKGSTIDEKDIEVKFDITKTVTDKETNETATVKLNKYTGHQTTKYNDIRVLDYYVMGGLRHAVLGHTKHRSKYVIREDGEVFCLNEKGEMKLKVQYFHESGGVKNKALRAAGKDGGTVYKTVSLWSKYCFLTHKLVQEYVTHEKSTNEYYISNGTRDSIVRTGKKTATNGNFYKGRMPNDFNKRCYRA